MDLSSKSISTEWYIILFKTYLHFIYLIPLCRCSCFDIYNCSNFCCSNITSGCFFKQWVCLHPYILLNSILSVFTFNCKVVNAWAINPFLSCSTVSSTTTAVVSTPKLPSEITGKTVEEVNCIFMFLGCSMLLLVCLLFCFYDTSC